MPGINTPSVSNSPANRNGPAIIPLFENNQCFFFSTDLILREYLLINWEEILFVNFYVDLFENNQCSRQILRILNWEKIFNFYVDLSF